MKTLFISDLDGTLLRSTSQISRESCEIINDLTAQGACFSYATARSSYTALSVTEGLVCRLPVITKNGTFIEDLATRDISWKNVFSDEEAEEIYSMIRRNHLYPMVNSWKDGKELYYYNSAAVTEEIQWFLDTHKNDKRIVPLQGESDILSGEIFYFSCIGTGEMLQEAYDEIRQKYRCILSKDTYVDKMWLEIMPMQATKAHAALQLKSMCGCDYLVVFGDGLNDIPMFQLADESYAVQNAVKELKEIATGTISSNQDDGVARWLHDNYRRYI